MIKSKDLRDKTGLVFTITAHCPKAASALLSFMFSYFEAILKAVAPRTDKFNAEVQQVEPSRSATAPTRSDVPGYVTVNNVHGDQHNVYEANTA